MEEDGWGEREQARRVETSQPRINHFTSGRGIRCRRSLRARIATALQLPVRWLSGEWDHLPFMHFHESDDGNRPARAELAEARFVGAAFKAFERDALSQDRDDPGRPSFSEGARTFPMDVSRLVDPKAWQGVLLATDDGTPVEISPGDYEEATAALARAFGIILKLWMKGHVRLDYRRLLSLPTSPNRKTSSV